MPAGPPTTSAPISAKLLRDAKQDAAVLTDPASIAWLLNIRGGDVPFTPFALGFALVHADGATDLFIDPAKLPAETRAWLGNAVSVADRDALLPALAKLKGKPVRVDPPGSPVWFAQQLRKAGAVVAAGNDPCLLPKACKNDAEQHGARAAHLRDAVAVCRFLHWLSAAAPTGQETEMSAADALLGFRREVDGLPRRKFPRDLRRRRAWRDHPLSGDRGIEPADQAERGLSDRLRRAVSRTERPTSRARSGPARATPPDEIRDRVTRVMQGHIAIATAVFPKGVGGAHLDAFARRALWQVGLDYDHGTGHGVGSYLSVHEGPGQHLPPGAAGADRAGMILSNEPGFYLPDHYGIRLENLLLVQPAELPAAASRSCASRP